MLVLLGSYLYTSAGARAAESLTIPAKSADVSAYELIIAMNSVRMANGLPALVEDPIINAVAQSTAEIMAANQMSWHIGDVSGRLAAAGYGGGSKVWATENFAVGNHSIDEIMVIWSDASHMIPAVNPAYCHIGAGVAKSSNGRTYYVLQAAYTAGQSCGEYKSPAGPGAQPGGGNSRQGGVSQLIVPVKTVAADSDGKVFHVVEAGQSLWAIAVAYKITIKDLETWNNLSRDSKLQIGQRLFIPGSNTEGYSTPTPVGMIEVSTPDPEGKIVHTVKAYHTLITIAKAYGVTMETILALNGIQTDWPLQIGQKLVIHPGSVTPSSTPRPIERLTPDSDGKYYHTVKSGETLWWIASLYEVRIADLMAWNGLNDSSILRPEQKLVLQVTPPATETPTPAPASATPTLVTETPSLTPIVVRTQAALALTGPNNSASAIGDNKVIWIAPVLLASGGLLLFVFFSRKKM